MAIAPSQCKGGRIIKRNSFIQLSKLHNVEGRIDYISNPRRQENLYATYQTVDQTTEIKFWKNLAKENRQEFTRSGTEGKCIEARELIIALPEVYREYNPQQVIELFTNDFKERHQVECVSALHHNKKKNNYHIHLIFSERQLLEKPEVKIASRNMFYNEQGKHVRTKKELLGEDGMIHKGCKIIAKGEIYESRMFANKNLYFKSKEFLAEEKIILTDLMNQYIVDSKEHLQVFDRSGVYLPTKKIGKNNPKSAEITSDNRVRQEWNYFVDEALLAGMEEKNIRRIKREEITLPIKESILKHGSNPDLFRVIVNCAILYLKNIIKRWQAPPEPILKVDIIEFQKMRTVKEKLINQAQAIRQVEQETIPQLQARLDDVKGIFKGKERKEAEENLENAGKRLLSMKSYYGALVRECGYESVSDFMKVYRRAEKEIVKYQKEVEQYEAHGGRKPPERESIQEKLRVLTERNRKMELEKGSQIRRGRGAR